MTSSRRQIYSQNKEKNNRIISEVGIDDLKRTVYEETDTIDTAIPNNIYTATVKHEDRRYMSSKKKKKINNGRKKNPRS